MKENREKEIMNIEPPPISSIPVQFEGIRNALYSYIPSPLLNDVNISKIESQTVDCGLLQGVDTKRYLRKLLDNSNNQLKRYEDAAELLQNILIYNSFSFNFKRFGGERHKTAEMLTAALKPFVFRSIKGEEFAVKCDFLLYFTTHVHVRYELMNLRVPPKNLMDYMNSMDERFRNYYEFFKYDEKIFDGIMTNLDEFMSNKNDGDLIENPLMEKLCSAFDTFHHHPPNDSSSKISSLESFRKLTDPHPELFLPYNKEDKPAIVRIFHDYNRKFVMTSELFNNRIMKNLEPKTEKLPNGLQYSLDLDTVFRKYPDQVEQISFIPIPIKRAKHAAVPIVTPTGDHCILASDALLEILCRLISALKVFQKFDMDMWKNVDSYIETLLEAFPVNTNCILFIDTKEYDRLTEQADRIGIRKKIAQNNKKKKGPKICREIGKYGFDLEFLKEELNYLELTEAFPDIQLFTEKVFSHVFECRKSEFTGSSDLIDAVEQCQLTCLLNRYTMLKSFFHNQNACHRFAHVQCETCFPQIYIKRFTETIWKEYEESELKIRNNNTSQPKSVLGWVMDIPERKSIITNFNMMTSEEIEKHKPNFFLMDSDDIKFATETKKAPKNLLFSLDNFTKATNKRIYIRFCEFNRSKYVFTDDILEILPIVLRQQGNCVVSSYSDLLEEYRKEWEQKDLNFHRMIELKDFELILERFDVNKALITIVPDPCQRITLDGMRQGCVLSYETIYTSSGTTVMSIPQVMLFIFECFVCGINWEMDCCEVHPKCKEDYKTKIIELLDQYLSYTTKESVFFVSFDYIEHIIKTLNEHCYLKLQKALGLPSVQQTWIYPTVDQSYSYYVQFFDSYGLKKRFNTEEYTKYDFYRWGFRTEYIRMWCEVFFTEESHRAIDVMIRTAAISRLPAKLLEEHKALIAEHALGFTLETIPNEKLVPRPEQQSDESKELAAMTRRVEELEKLLHIKKAEIEQLKSGESIPKVRNNQLCEKCSNTSNEARETDKVVELENALKLARTALEGSEKCIDSLSKRIEEWEQEQLNTNRRLDESNASFSKLEKDKKEEIEKLKLSEKQKTEKQLAELKQEKDNQVSALKIENAKLSEMNKKNSIGHSKVLKEKNSRILVLEQENSKLAKEKKQEIENLKKEQSQVAKENKKELEELKRNLSNYSDEIKKLRAEKETAEAQLKEINNEQADIIRKLEDKSISDQSEIADRNRVIQVLQESSEKQEKADKELQNKISKIRTILDSMSLSAPSPPNEYFILALQRTKDIFNADNNPLKLAKDMVEKLLKSRPDLHQMATYEYQQYEGKVQNYLQKVEENIQKLKNSEISISKLPEFPSLSDRFIEEYWKEIDPKEDSECLICFFELKSEEKTLKCEHCKKIVHMECASKWLKIHRSCPHCRREQLDPNEFPALG